MGTMPSVLCVAKFLIKRSIIDCMHNTGILSLSLLVRDSGYTKLAAINSLLYRLYLIPDFLCSECVIVVRCG